jgi:hypothetical protein
MPPRDSVAAEQRQTGSSVADITNSASTIHLDRQFDSFLFAAIGESKEGMCITVLSALARLNIDPWKKAAELSRLPGEVAGQKLASLIATLPDLRSANLEPGMIDRLVTLLPTGKTAIDLKQAIGFGVDLNARTLITYVTLMAVIIGAEYVWENNRLQNQAESFRAPMVGAVQSSLPPPKSKN